MISFGRIGWLWGPFPNRILLMWRFQLSYTALATTSRDTCKLQSSSPRDFPKSWNEYIETIGLCSPWFWSFHSECDGYLAMTMAVTWTMTPLKWLNWYAMLCSLSLGPVLDDNKQLSSDSAAKSTANRCSFGDLSRVELYQLVVVVSTLQTSGSKYSTIRWEGQQQIGARPDDQIIWATQISTKMFQDVACEILPNDDPYSSRPLLQLK